MRFQARRAPGAVLLALGLLAGCSSAPGSDPIAWWRQLEGGRLAEERPLPPNADAPYPNLSSVPPRPAVSEAAVRARIAAGLESDRRDGAFAASQPLGPAAPARPAPPPPAPAPAAMGASLVAANSPAPAPAPAPAVAPAAAPRPAPAAAAPAPTPAPTPAPVAGLAEAAIALPAGPPPAPRLPGVAAVTVPTPVRRAPPPAAAAAVVVVPGAPAAVAFQPRSAALPEGAEAALRRLAATRAGRDIVVQGHGEAGGEDAASQAAALKLGFDRARALAAALAQAGVPEGAMLLTGYAIGRGGMVRIAD